MSSTQWIIYFITAIKFVSKNALQWFSFWLSLLIIYISGNWYTWWVRDRTERTGKGDPRWHGHTQDKSWLSFPLPASSCDLITVTTSWSLTVLLCKTPECLSYDVRSCIFAREGYWSLTLIIRQWLQGKMPSVCTLYWVMMKNCNPKALPVGMVVLQCESTI